jgi:hypothetical protein
VRFEFRALPDPGSGAVRARPIIDVVVEGLEIAPQASLLDSGATAIRFGSHVADLCGIALAGAPETSLAVGGSLIRARMAEVGLMIDDGSDNYGWIAPVWFCDPWTPSFGLLGLTGFFDRFIVTIAAYEEWIDLRPIG